MSDRLRRESSDVVKIVAGAFLKFPQQIGHPTVFEFDGDLTDW
jgi:hypothetical protein